MGVRAGKGFSTGLEKRTQWVLKVQGLGAQYLPRHERWQPTLRHCNGHIFINGYIDIEHIVIRRVGVCVCGGGGGAITH